MTQWTASWRGHRCSSWAPAIPFDCLLGFIQVQLLAILAAESSKRNLVLTDHSETANGQGLSLLQSLSKPAYLAHITGQTQGRPSFLKRWIIVRAVRLAGGLRQSLRSCTKFGILAKASPAQEIEWLPTEVSADKLSAGHQPVQAMTTDCFSKALVAAANGLPGGPQVCPAERLTQWQKQMSR